MITRILLFFPILLILFYGDGTQGREIGLSRVVNGISVNITEAPYQVSLRLVEQNWHFCGGIIITETYILTAAHCISPKFIEEARIVSGTTFRTKEGETRQAVRVIVHEKYENDFYYTINDIALIQVKPPFVFSKNVAPIPLPKSYKLIPANTDAILTGWGQLRGQLGLPEILQKAVIKVAEQDYCAKVMKNQSYQIFPTNICAYDPTMRKGQCNGDSGGPLVVDGELAGIVSWSIKDPYCASTTYPGVYTRVSKYIGWILENTYQI